VPAINYIYITEFADPVTFAYDEGMGEFLTGLLFSTPDARDCIGS
jgi:hypothetical protein